MGLPVETRTLHPVLVSSIETALDLRRQAMGMVVHDSDRAAMAQSAAATLARRMKLMKSIRFNAAERLELKQSVSLFSQSIVALYFIGLAVWQAVYAGQIDDATARLVTFIQIVSSVFTLMMALLEAMNDYKLKAYQLHACGLTISEIVQELEIDAPTDPSTVQDFRKRYNEALKDCPNHHRSDYLFAKNDALDDLWIAVEAHGRYLLNVYGLYAFFLFLPPLLLWAHV
jgi:hypothetical protein